MPLVDWDSINLEQLEKRNPAFTPQDDLPNDKWLLELYHNMLKMRIDSNDQGHKYWMDQFSKGADRRQVLSYFQQTAKNENKNLFKKSLKEVIDHERPNPRIAYVMPEHGEDVLMSTSVLKSLKEVYPEHDIYFLLSQSILDSLMIVLTAIRFVILEMKWMTAFILKGGLTMTLTLI